MRDQGQKDGIVEVLNCGIVYQKIPNTACPENLQTDRIREDFHLSACSFLLNLLLFLLIISVLYGNSYSNRSGCTTFLQLYRY